MTATLWVWIGSPDDTLDLVRYVRATENDIMVQPCVRSEIERLNTVILLEHKARLEAERELVEVTQRSVEGLVSVSAERNTLAHLVAVERQAARD